MTEDTLLPFDLPAVQHKKVTADFAGGSISSDGGLVLLRAAERRLGLAEVLTGCIREWRDPDRVVHTLPAMLPACSRSPADTRMPTTATRFAATHCSSWPSAGRRRAGTTCVPNPP